MRHGNARIMLITGELIDSLWDLYRLNFSDPRLEVNGDALSKPETWRSRQRRFSLRFTITQGDGMYKIPR